MRSPGRQLALIAAALSAATAAPAATADERVVEKQRMVVRVEAEPAGRGFAYVFVDHEDGEPVLLDSIVADRGYLGVSLLELTPELRRHFGAPEAAGVMISGVESESPAAAAGLRAGDILTSIDGKPVASAATVTRMVSEGEEGQSLELGLLRGDQERTVAATLVTRKRKQLDLGGLIRVPGRRSGVERPEPERPGVPLIELDPESIDLALGLMRRHFESEDWREQLERAGGDRQNLERRIRELEERLRELERQLRELPE